MIILVERIMQICVARGGGDSAAANLTAAPFTDAVTALDIALSSAAGMDEEKIMAIKMLTETAL